MEHWVLYENNGLGSPHPKTNDVLYGD